MAHEVAVPSLRAEPYSFAAIQETSSSFTTDEVARITFFYPGLFHLAQSQDRTGRLCFWCKKTIELIPHAEEPPWVQFQQQHDSNTPRC